MYGPRLQRLSGKKTGRIVGDLPGNMLEFHDGCGMHFGACRALDFEKAKRWTMSQINSYGWTADFPAWRGEVVARFQDFLLRKKGVAVDRWRGLLRRLDESASFTQVSATLRQVLRRLRRERVATGAAVDVEVETGDPADLEFETLCRQVLESDRKTTIENYSAYLFTVDMQF